MTASVPSWVIPGTYAENLRFLSDKEAVRGVELLFFIYDEEARTLFSREEVELRAYGDRFTFTAHLPDRLIPDHEELVEHTTDFVDSWVIHPSPPAESEALARLLDDWRRRYGDRFFLENTSGGRLEALRRLLPDAPLCMDTGHLLLEGGSPGNYAAVNGGLIREVHLHGLGPEGDGMERAKTDGRLPDHRAFSPCAPWFAELLPFLSAFGGVVNAEAFSWEEADSILRSLP